MRNSSNGLVWVVLIALLLGLAALFVFQNAWLGAMVLVALLWTLRATLVGGLVIQLLGATLMVTLFGLPLALSVDNLIAGTGLGLIGISPVVPAIGFGLVTAIMSFAGLCVGRAAVRVIPVRADLLSGVSLVAAAVVLPIVFAG